MGICLGASSVYATGVAAGVGSPCEGMLGGGGGGGGIGMPLLSDSGFDGAGGMFALTAKLFNTYI